MLMLLLVSLSFVRRFVVGVVSSGAGSSGRVASKVEVRLMPQLECTGMALPSLCVACPLSRVSSDFKKCNLKEFCTDQIECALKRAYRTVDQPAGLLTLDCVILDASQRHES